MWQTAGQDRAVGLLRQGLERGRLAHAYLLLGPEQVGKGTLARDLAKALNCTGLEPPCGVCSSCRRIEGGLHPDVQTIQVEEQDETERRRDIGIDQIRELQRWASLEPFEGGCRVFIINGAERLSLAAANCLLKTLEEPPPKVVILLLAESDEALLPTIRSRCQRLELRTLAASEVEGLLRERWQVDAELARRLAGSCGGRLGWALSALANEDLLQERSTQAQRLLSLAHADREERFAFAAELAQRFGRERSSVGDTLGLWLSLARDLLLIKGGCPERMANLEETDRLLQQARGYSLGQVSDIIKALWACLRHLEQNVNPRLALEVLMLDLPRPNSRKEEEEARSPQPHPGTKAALP